MAKWCIFGSLLVAVSRSARFGDEHVDRVVFGESGDTISFYAPALPSDAGWYVRSCNWPEERRYRSKVTFLGPATARTGFALKNFERQDQGRVYSITTNGVVTHYRAVLANRVEVDVDATLYISLAFNGTISSITWKYTSTSTTMSTDFVEVLSDSRFTGRAHVDATGKLFVREWSWRDDGFFTAEINGEEFAEAFKVVSFVRVKPGDDLNLAPNIVGPFSQFSWYRDSTVVVEYIAGSGGVVYRFSHCVTDSGNCFFDTRTGKLTIKSWQHSLDGVFTMMVNGISYKNGVKVVGNVVFADYRESLQLDPPAFTGNLQSVRWLFGGNLVADLENDGVVTYYTTCQDYDCILNTTTGRLTIPTWWPYDTERYTVDVNSFRQPHQYLVAGVAKLDLDYHDATIVVHTVSDIQTILICDGDFDGAEPVKYFWRLRDTSTWLEGKYKMETPHVLVKVGRPPAYLYDACKVKNPVSELVITLN